MLKRLILPGIIIIYLLIGLNLGLSVKSIIPAVNGFGQVYFAVTWPAWVQGSPVKIPVPRWAFSFEDGR